MQISSRSGTTALKIIGWKPAALDGGYGWVVVAGAFLIHVIADGFVYSFGIIEEELIESILISIGRNILNLSIWIKSDQWRLGIQYFELEMSGPTDELRQVTKDVFSNDPVAISVVRLFVMNRKEQLVYTSLSGSIQDKGVSCDYTAYFVDRRRRIQQRRNEVVEQLQQHQSAELSFSNSASRGSRRSFALSTPGRVVHRLLRLVHRHESVRLEVTPQIPRPVQYINAEPLVVHYGSFICMYVKAKHLAMEHRCLCNAAK
ncbi:MonoCarboxylate Transporter family [Ditylenchus destructor]|uniref:MonoCarboxylate Transporter family n=1 Tax=Ditylenchus destructor TaxID=166010 RepID=A0AAD4R7D3_9BILA|nr:MonoCarboxylate Transporter family [Ditylenchus destructor]